MRKLPFICCACSFYVLMQFAFYVSYGQDRPRSPLEWATFVADNFLEQVQQDMDYTLSSPYKDAEVVDLGSLSFSTLENTAYALTDIYAKGEQAETFDIAFTGYVRIWVNDEEVFSGQNADISLEIDFDERTYIIPNKFTANLRSGRNKLLVEYGLPAGTRDRKLILQSKNLGRYPEPGKDIYVSIKKYAPDIKVTNWLLLGPFKESQPEELPLFTVYEGDDGKFSWALPKINLEARYARGGKKVEWNYHVGGFIWALRELSTITETSRYVDFANEWCNNMLDMRPLIDYQTRNLFATRSLNWSLVDRPMLDYTAAPTLPFLSRLLLEDEFEERFRYQSFVDSVMHYIGNEQFRVEQGIFGRQYTADVSVWVDDMFMGLPYMVNYARLTEDEMLRQKIFSDVAGQVLSFAELLRDPASGLFRQGAYPTRPDYRVPHWSRGNGWAIWAMTEVLNGLPDDHAQYATVLELYRQHVEALKRYQNQQGTWHNLLDDPRTEEEASGTAIFTLAIARGIRYGWIDADPYLPVLKRAWQGLLAFVDDKGDLQGVKGGTNFSSDPANYARTAMIASDTHGVFPFLFACLEMHKLVEQRKDIDVLPDDREKQLEIYLLMGQSNMAGRGKIDSIYAWQQHDRVMMLDRDLQWVLARHPIHFDKLGISGVGLGLQFGMEMANTDTTMVIGLVPCAVGGTSITKWAPGQYDEATDTYPYDDALKRISAALQHGKVKGMLWHQGEADANDLAAPSYVDEFLKLVERVRTMVDDPKLPVVVGQLGQYKANYHLINQEIGRLPDIDPYITVVSSEGLLHKGDGVHFDSASLIEFGTRYFEGMRKIKEQVTTVK